MPVSMLCFFNKLFFLNKSLKLFEVFCFVERKTIDFEFNSFSLDKLEDKIV